MPTTRITNTSSNKVFIENCGALKTDVMALLGAALNTLPSVIHDLRLGINSPHGYKAWFKSNASSAYVEEMLMNIYTTSPKSGLIPEPRMLTGPHFTCVTPSTIHLYPWVGEDPFYTCTHFPEMGAYYHAGSSYIFLCPFFWSRLPAPTTQNCPRVIHNRFVGNRILLTDYKIYILIHEMVHFYLGYTSLTPHTFIPEQYQLNECVALDRTNSLRNPSNYQYYIASKS